uniref:Uncharacterized protein n=1 Tax=Anguilla anguilla TaxID=7936 RepID=A0A0E9XVE1_ANGAN
MLEKCSQTHPTGHISLLICFCAS